MQSYLEMQFTNLEKSRICDHTSELYSHPNYTLQSERRAGGADPCPHSCPAPKKNAPVVPGHKPMRSLPTNRVLLKIVFPGDQPSEVPDCLRRSSSPVQASSASEPQPINLILFDNENTVFFGPWKLICPLFRTHEGRHIS